MTHKQQNRNKKIKTLKPLHNSSTTVRNMKSEPNYWHYIKLAHA